MCKHDKILCKKCGKRYKHRQSCDKHTKCSTCNKSGILLQCKGCDKTFSIPYSLKQHALKCKGDEEKKFCCNICHSKFRSNWVLERHRRSCNIEYLMCIPCGKEFQANVHFLLTLKFHFCCSICYIFRDKGLY